MATISADYLFDKDERFVVGIWRSMQFESSLIAVRATSRFQLLLRLYPTPTSVVNDRDAEDRYFKTFLEVEQQYHTMLTFGAQDSSHHRGPWLGSHQEPAHCLPRSTAASRQLVFSTRTGGRGSLRGGCLYHVLPAWLAMVSPYRCQGTCTQYSH